MEIYPILKNGAILRARPGCEHPARVMYVAVDSLGETFLLDFDEYHLLAQCTGMTTMDRIKGLEVKIREDVDFSRILSFQTIPSVLPSRQSIVVPDLIAPCRQAIWHLTRSCNMRCQHCYYRYGQLTNQKNDFTPEEIRIIAANLAGLGIEVVRLSGGEAVLDPNFSVAVDALTQNCLPTIINTNGWEGQYGVISLFRNNPYLRAVQISLDGPEFAHNRLRQNNSFKDIEMNLRVYVGAGIHVRLISMLTQAWMQRDLVWEMCRRMADVGITDWLVEVPSVTGSLTQDLTREQVGILDTSKTFAEFLETQPHSITSFSLAQVFDWPNRDSAVVKTLSDFICSHDLGLLSFGPEGISYCTLFREQFGNGWKDFGSMETSDYKELWNRIAAQRVSRKIADNPKCVSCDLFPICQGGCPGQYDDPPNFVGCDHHSRNLAEVKKRLYCHKGWRL